MKVPGLVVVGFCVLESGALLANRMYLSGSSESLYRPPPVISQPVMGQQRPSFSFRGRGQTAAVSSPLFTGMQSNFAGGFGQGGVSSLFTGS